MKRELSVFFIQIFHGFLVFLLSSSKMAFQKTKIACEEANLKVLTYLSFLEEFYRVLNFLYFFDSALKHIRINHNL